jgi:MarR family transcriptional regulator, organic hydroperoxide resistance regulator
LRNDFLSDVDYKLWAAIQQTRHETHEIFKIKLEPFDISPAQAAALIIVATASPDKTTVPAQISHWLLRGRPAVSVLLKRMEQKGLINKTHDLGKKNLVSITLTEKGKQVYDQISGLEIMHEVLGFLSPEQRDQLTQSLQAILARTRELRGLPQK